MKIQLQLVAVEAPQLERYNCWPAPPLRQFVSESICQTVHQRCSACHNVYDRKPTTENQKKNVSKKTGAMCLGFYSKQSGRKHAVLAWPRPQKRPKSLPPEP